MPLPTALDYNGVIQFPTECFRDRDLRSGKAETDLLGLPRPYSGNCADVYRVAGGGSEAWAVKCFTREVRDLRGRYQAIGEHLGKQHRPFNVEFRYLEEGIKVKGVWVPVLKMRWIEGLTLNQFASEQADNAAILERLAKMWVRLAEELKEAQIAHGDLQHGNVLLVRGRKDTSLALKLIDYDGMWIPALSGKPPQEVGHPDYQHPQRLKEGGYFAQIDCFSHLVIYTALRALAVGGRPLWDRFANGDNLLFCKKDFTSPASSELLGELIDHPDPDLRILAADLVLAATDPLSSVPFLPDILPGGIPKPLSAQDAARARAILGKPAQAPPLAPRRPGAHQPGTSDSQAETAALEPGHGRLSSPGRKSREEIRKDREVSKFPTLLVGGLAGGLLLFVALGVGLWAMTRPTRRPLPPPSPLARLVASAPQPADEGTRFDLPVVVNRKGLEAALEVRLELPEGLTSPSRVLHLAPGDERAQVRLSSQVGSQGVHQVELSLWHEGKQIDTLSVPVQVRPLPRPILSPLAALTLEVGKTRVVNLGVQPNGSPPPFRVEFAGLPDGVTFRQLPSVPGLEGRLVLPVELTATEPSLPHSVRVVVHAGRVSSAPALLELRVQGTRITTPLAVRTTITPPATLLLRRGGTKTVRVGIDRQGHAEKVTLSLMDLPAGITASAVRVPGDQSAGNLELHVAPQTSLGLKRVRLEASVAGRRVAGAEVRLSIVGKDTAIFSPPTDVVKASLVLSGHRNKVVCVALSRDGRWIASGGNDRTIRLWDRNTGKEVRQMEGVPGSAWGVAFSPDGTILAGGGNGGFLSLWDVKTGSKLRSLPSAAKAYRCVAFAPDGKTFTTGTFARSVEEWDTATLARNRSYVGHTASLMSLAISADGKLLLTGPSRGDGSVRLWDRTTGTLLRSLKGHPAQVIGVAFSPDSKRLATTCYDGSIRLWNTDTGARLREMRSGSSKTCGVVFSTDGNFLFTGSDEGAITKWDLATGRAVQTLSGHTGNISQLAISVDGRTLVSSGGNSVRVWNIGR